MSQDHTWFGRGGHQLGFHGGGVAGLPAAFTYLGAGPQQPVHHRDRAQVGAFVQQRGPHLGGGEVAEPFAVEHLDDVVAFGDAERPWRA